MNTINASSRPDHRLDPWSDERAIAALRLILALSALTLSYGSDFGSDPAEYRGPTLVVLSLYSAYSAVLTVLARRGLGPQRVPAYWLDTVWYTAFTAVGGGPASMFFSFYFFAILQASFRGGTRSGVHVTVAAVVLSSAAGYLVYPDNRALPLDRFALRPIYLLVIGFLMARLGSLDLLFRRRLTLLKEVSTIANPRFGEGQTIALVLERLRLFHGAEAALFVESDSGWRSSTVRRADTSGLEQAVVTKPVPDDLSAALAQLPSSAGAMFDRGDVQTIALPQIAGDGASSPPDSARCAEIAAMLQCRSFVTVPMRSDGNVARVMILSNSDAAFAPDDAEFLAMVVEHVSPIIDRLRLTDRLAFDAATQEREHLANDLHDSVIQPYIGLQLGLAAALQQARAGGDATPIIERLVNASEREVASLRQEVRRLRTQGEDRTELPAAIRRLAETFGAMSELEVELRVPDALALESRLASHVCQLVAEGLSNVRRHTDAKHAAIVMERHELLLLIGIENEASAGVPFQPFVPRSITERVAALGGRVQVRPREGGGTMVQMEIPV